jgi:hypothetical protein
MSSHDLFGHLKHKLWPKERPEIKLAIWLSTIKSRESIWFLSVYVACDISLKSSWKVTTFLYISLQSKVYMRSYTPPKSWKSQLWEFRNSHLGVSGQNAIWMWSLWRSVENIIRGKVVVSPKSGLWWVLWVRSCLWLFLAPKVFKLCTNQLVVWFV